MPSGALICKPYIPAGSTPYATSEPPPGRSTSTQLSEVLIEEEEVQNGGAVLLGEVGLRICSWLQGNQMGQSILRDEVRGALSNPQIYQLTNLPSSSSGPAFQGADSDVGYAWPTSSLGSDFPTELSTEGATDQRSDASRTPEYQARYLLPGLWDSLLI